MVEDYRSLDDEDKVFLLRYYHWFKSTNIDERQDESITITRIRNDIKPFYESKDTLNSDIRKYFADREWIEPEVPNSDKIVFYGGVMEFMNKISDNIIEIFLSPEFNMFLHESKIPELFEKKRGIIDFIHKIKIDERNKSPSYIKSKILDYIIRNFCFMANLYLAHKGKFIF